MLKRFFADVRNPDAHGAGVAPQPKLDTAQTTWAIEFCMIGVKSTLSAPVSAAISCGVDGEEVDPERMAEVGGAKQAANVALWVAADKAGMCPI